MILIERTNIPRMRTAPKIVAEIKALDPETEITEYYIRKLAREGRIPVVWAGCKALINLDDVLELCHLGTERAKPMIDSVNGIRRINAK